MTLNQMAMANGFCEDKKQTLKEWCEMLKLDDFEFENVTHIVIFNGRRQKTLCDCYLEFLDFDLPYNRYSNTLVKRYSIEFDHCFDDVEIYVEVE